jgi:tRNA pseudouridine32 synthase/23S rRNA pseudouridine746 synthase
MFQKRVIEKEYEALAPRLHGRDFPFTYRSRMVEGDKFFHEGRRASRIRKR